MTSLWKPSIGQFFYSVPVTVPEVFAKVNSAQFPSRFDGYWRRASLLLANFFALSPVTVPEVFAKVNSAQFPSRFDGYWGRASLLLAILLLCPQ